MKRTLIFIFGTVFFLTGMETKAQMLDDLFDEEELQSSESDRAEEQKPAPVKSSPAKTPSEVPQPSSSSSSGNTKSADSGKTASQTFSIPLNKQPIQNAVPQIGSGKPEEMPNLGKRDKKKKDEENLSLFEMRARRTHSRDVNVMEFDIAGIMLRMKPEEVIEHAQESGFSLKFQNTKIPHFNKWKYHRKCLENMLFSYKGKRGCIREMAQTDNSEYITQLVFENRALRETITVDFTSNYTENQAYRIYYLSKGNHSLGTTDEAHFLKERRRAEFLEMLIRKYGQPEDEQALLWGIAGFGAVLQADISETFLDASLVLEDLNFEEEDFRAIEDEDAKSEALEKFSF